MILKKAINWCLEGFMLLAAMLTLEVFIIVVVVFLAWLFA